MGTSPETSADLPLGDAVEWSPVAAPAGEVLRGERVTLRPFDLDRRRGVAPRGDEGRPVDLGLPADRAVRGRRGAARGLGGGGGRRGLRLLRDRTGRRRAAPWGRPATCGSTRRTARSRSAASSSPRPCAARPPATEAIFLLARHVFDDLGYRRLEWKCNALNAGSRRGRRALRLPLRGRLPPGRSRQGPQPRHRLVLDPRRGVARGPRRLRGLARPGELRRRRHPEALARRPDARRRAARQLIRSRHQRSRSRQGPELRRGRRAAPLPTRRRRPAHRPAGAEPAGPGARAGARGAVAGARPALGGADPRRGSSCSRTRCRSWRVPTAPGVGSSGRRAAAGPWSSASGPGSRPPRRCGGFHAAEPSANVEMQRLEWDDQEEAVLGGRVDVAYVRRPVDERGLRLVPLYKERRLRGADGRPPARRA